MPVTKAEEMKNDLESIKSQINDLSINMNLKFEEFLTKIQTNEDKLFTEVEKLRKTNTNLSLQLDLDRKSFQSEIQELKEMNEKKLEIDESMMKEFSDLKAENVNLKSRIVNLEKSSFGDSQHSRGGTIEIDGIPNNVGEEPEKLEGAVIKILKSIDVSCNQDDIEAVHRLPSKGVIKPAIIKFLSRKTAESAYRNKHKLKIFKCAN